MSKKSLKFGFIILMFFMQLLLQVSSVKADLTTDLVFYWSLDNGFVSGSTMIDSLGDYNGTINSPDTGSTGKIGQAFDFNGTNDRVEVSALNNFDYGSNFTFAFWVEPNDLDRQFLYYHTGTAAINIALQDSNSIRFYIRDTNSNVYYADSNENLPTNGWYHIILTWDGVAKSMNIYINNTLQGKDVISNANIGQVKPNANAFLSRDEAAMDGLIDEVACWSRVLTSDEREDIFNSGSGLAYPFSFSLTQVNLTSFDIASISNYTNTSVTINLSSCVLNDGVQDFNGTNVSRGACFGNTTIDALMGDISCVSQTCVVNKTSSDRYYTINASVISYVDSVFNLSGVPLMSSVKVYVPATSSQQYLYGFDILGTGCAVRVSDNGMVVIS